MRLVFIFCFTIAVQFTTLSQTKIELPFIEYLIAKEEYDAAIKLLNSTNNELQTQNFKDSINYLKGWSLYSTKKLKQSSNYLNLVTKNSVFYSKSQLFASYNNIHLKNYTLANNILNSFNPLNKKDSISALLLKSGIALLNRNFKKYDTIQKEINKEFYAIKKENATICSIANNLKHKKKSPTLAAIMSVIIPGSGKIYLGKTGQGISTMLLVTGLGLVTAENFAKRGPEKFSSILFATAFTTFYVGNIYGTIKLSKISNEEYNSYQDAKILFNIHIPLRNLYN